MQTNTAPTGETEADDSSAGVSIGYGSLSKTLYKINGSDPVSNPAQVKAGDTITYRFTYTMPSSDVEDLKFIDYLPKPVLDAIEMTTFEATLIPSKGHWGFSPRTPSTTSITMARITSPLFQPAPRKTASPSTTAISTIQALRPLKSLTYCF